MHLGGRRGRFYGSEGLKDPVGVLGPCRNQPRIARTELDRLSLDGELGTSGQHIADRLISAPVVDDVGGEFGFQGSRSNSTRFCGNGTP